MPAANLARLRRGYVLHEPRHLRDAVRLGARSRGGNARRAGSFRRSLFRRGGRLCPHDAAAGGHLAASRAGPGQRSGQFSQRAQGALAGGERGGAAQHAAPAPRRAAHRRHRSPGAGGLKPRPHRAQRGRYRPGCLRRRPGRLRRARAGGHADRARGLLLERGGRTGRRAAASLRCPAGTLAHPRGGRHSDVGPAGGAVPGRRSAAGFGLQAGRAAGGGDRRPALRRPLRGAFGSGLGQVRAAAASLFPRARRTGAGWFETSHSGGEPAASLLFRISRPPQRAGARRLRHPRPGLRRGERRGSPARPGPGMRRGPGAAAALPNAPAANGRRTPA